GLSQVQRCLEPRPTGAYDHRVVALIHAILDSHRLKVCVTYGATSQRSFLCIAPLCPPRSEESQHRGHRDAPCALCQSLRGTETVVRVVPTAVANLLFAYLMAKRLGSKVRITSEPSARKTNPITQIAASDA